MNFLEAIKKVVDGEAIAFRCSVWIPYPVFSHTKRWLTVYGFGIRWVDNGVLYDLNNTINLFDEWEVLCAGAEGADEVEIQKMLTFKSLDEQLSTMKVGRDDTQRD